MTTIRIQLTTSTRRATIFASVVSLVMFPLLSSTVAAADGAK